MLTTALIPWTALTVQGWDFTQYNLQRHQYDAFSKSTAYLNVNGRKEGGEEVVVRGELFWSVSLREQG